MVAGWGVTAQYHGPRPGASGRRITRAPWKAVWHCRDLAKSAVPTPMSGANPDDRYRHRQAYRESADNRQGKFAKQSYPRSHLVYRHASYSNAWKVRSRHRDEAGAGSEVRALCLEGSHAWCAEMVNGILTARARPTIVAREPIRWPILRA